MPLKFMQVNGFDHKNPLTELVLKDLSVEDVGLSYIRYYPKHSGNRGEKDIGATLFQTNYLEPESLETFFESLYEYDVSELFKRLHKIGDKNEDWGLDLVALLRQTGLLIPELQFEATRLIAMLESHIMSTSRTPETPLHSGIGITCAKDNESYRKSLSGKMLPAWTKICRSWRQQYSDM